MHGIIYYSMNSSKKQNTEERLSKALLSKNKVELISITENAEKIITYCARVSNPKNQLNFQSAEKLIKYLITHKHWSPFEMASMTVQIKTSRAISSQILRHRSFTFQEFSQRYAAVDESGVEIYAARRQDDKNRQNSIDDLLEDIKQEWERRQLENWKKSFEHYKWAIDNNIAKECARFVLPLGTSTTMYMSGTIRSWIHYIELRSANGTQKEHMDIALECKDIFKRELPLIYQALWGKDEQEQKE
jgi:thymidylate synthase (FAD)